MRSIWSAACAALFVVLAFVLAPDSARAASLDYATVLPEKIEAEYGDQLPFSSAVSWENTANKPLMAIIILEYPGVELSTQIPFPESSGTLWLSIDDYFLNACVSGGGSIQMTLSVQIAYEDPSVAFDTIHRESKSVPCAWMIAPEIPMAIQSDVCGPVGNDELSFPMLPQGATIADDTDWLPNAARTITFGPAAGFKFKESTVTTQTYHDDLTRCSVTPLPPTQQHICGANNDQLIPDPQDGLISPEITWSENSFTYSYGAGEHFDIVGPNSWTFIDDGPCVVEPVLPTLESAVCGDNNDVITVPTQPDHITATASDWVGNQRTITFVPDENYMLPVDQDASVTFTDEGPCLVEPIPPSAATEVCGPNNDVFTVPQQPEHINLEVSGWDNNQSIVRLTPDVANGYAFPEGTQREFIYEDANTPCPTDAPVSPVQVEVCGPNNDLVSIPPQPDGVTLESNSDWIDNTRTIVFAIDPAFVTDGPTQFDLHDDNVPCPSPTPEPSPIPSPEPSPSPSPVPSPEPSPTPSPESSPSPAAVTKLPETGAGIGDQAPLGLAAGLLAALIIGIGVRRGAGNQYR